MGFARVRSGQQQFPIVTKRRATFESARRFVVIARNARRLSAEAKESVSKTLQSPGQNVPQLFSTVTPDERVPNCRLLIKVPRPRENGARMGHAGRRSTLASRGVTYPCCANEQLRASVRHTDANNGQTATPAPRYDRPHGFSKDMYDKWPVSETKLTGL
jgi:hypothetical protein